MSHDEELEWPACVVQGIRDSAERVEYLIDLNERLTAERDEARAERDDARDPLRAQELYRSAAWSEIERLRGLVERLRPLLIEAIAALSAPLPAPDRSLPDVARDLLQAADEARRERDELRDELRLTNAAGDQLLRVLLYCAQYMTPPAPGELCVEVTSFALDWSRVGYYIRTEGKYPDEVHVMQCLEGRERRWRNARFARINTTWPACLEIEGKENARLAHAAADREATRRES